MQYDYVRRTYGIDPRPGQLVKHTVTGKTGMISRENKSQGHYVMVRFNGQKHTVPCHPTELDYTAQP